MVALKTLPKTVLVFKTNLNTNQEPKVRRLLAPLSPITKVGFDFEDCDNILRVEAQKDISTRIVWVLQAGGYYCEELE